MERISPKLRLRSFYAKAFNDGVDACIRVLSVPSSISPEELKSLRKDVGQHRPKPGGVKD